MKFTILSVTGEGDFIINSKKEESEFQVTRSFQDLRFLEQQIFHSGQDLAGYIIPPFPESSVEGVIAEDQQLFNWLRYVVSHPLFGKSGLIEPFLTEKNIPPPGRIGKPLGLIKAFQDTIDSRKYAHRDCDPFFQEERDLSIKLCDSLQEASEAFNSTVAARHSLVQVLAHLSAALSLPIGDNEGLNKVAIKTNLSFSKALESYKSSVESEAHLDASTLGATLLLWSKFVESERDMLRQRTCLLVDYESANKRFDQARYQRRPEVEESKLNAERAFEKCSDIAREEIKRFKSDRIRDMTDSLREYSEAQLNLARENYKNLDELHKALIAELQNQS